MTQIIGCCGKCGGYIYDNNTTECSCEKSATNGGNRQVDAVVKPTLAEYEKRIKYLEDELFKLGAMNKLPCFCCGYNGEGYYQPDKHPCVRRHDKLSKCSL
jgi:hypothetical protein